MPQANRKRLRWAFGLAGVAVVILVLAGVFAFQALQARSALVSVAGDFQQVADDLRSGDPGSARTALGSARDQSRRADDATDGLLWSAATHVPAVGDDLAAVRTVAQVSRVLSDDVLPGAVKTSEVVDPSRLSPRKGRIPLAPLRKAAPEVVAADKELQTQAATVAAIDTSTLMRQVAGPVEDLQSKLAEAATLSSRASYAARLLPPMLGADGPRTYLVLFQNNAEIRATGGMPGALAVLRAKNGKLTMVGQGTAGDLGYHPKPPIALTREETDLFTPKLGMFGADVNFTPDFPRAAQLARAMWSGGGRQRVDGVLAADPVALSYLLDATGPVKVPGGLTLTSDNAVRVLLSDIYRKVPDAEQQNALFASAARAVFAAVASGQADPTTLLEGVARAGNEGRLFAWSDVRPEQALLSQTKIGGAVPRGAGRSPYVGVFMNDGTAAKMEYYLDHRVDVKPVSCTSSGRQALAVTVTLRSSAPRNAATLPPSVIGPRESGTYFGVKPGHMRINVHLYAPIDGWIKDAALDGGDAVMSENEHLGHPVGSQSVDLAPGQERRLTYTVMTGPDQTGPVELRVTPGVHGTGVGTVGTSACTGS